MSGYNSVATCSTSVDTYTAVHRYFYGHFHGCLWMWGGVMMTNFQLLLPSPNLLQSQSPFMVGRSVMANNQLLMQSPNMLKSQSPFTVEGRVSDNQFPAFDVESKYTKIPKSLYGRKWGGRVSDGQFPTFVAESKSPKIPKSLYREGGKSVMANFPTFDDESKSAKIPKSLYGWGWGVSVTTNFSTFNAEFKYAKIPKSFYGGGGSVMINFQLLLLSPNLLKSQSPFTGGGVSDDQYPTFDAESKSVKIPKSLYSGGEEVSQ